jgi:hypothetical protein
MEVLVEKIAAYGEVTPLCADLEKPQAPVLVETNIEILGVIVCSEASVLISSAS